MTFDNLASFHAHWDNSTPTIVLKFDSNVMHHGGLGAIRSLGRLGVPVYGVHEHRWAPAAYSRYLHGRFLWQPNAEDTDAVRTGLIQLAERIGRPSVLLATDDAGAIFLAENGDNLRSWFLFPRPPRDLPRQVAGKYSMYQLCRELDIACPETTLPMSLNDAHAFVQHTGYPVIAKLTTPWRHGTQKLRSTTILADRKALDSFHGACEADGTGFMLQEFIPGGPGQDWFVHGYCGADTARRLIFTGLKERSYPAHAGLTSLGHATANPRLVDEISALLNQLAYRGIFDLDLRFDARDGKYKLLDFNPRLGAQFRVFVDSAGLDVVRALYLDLTASEVPQGTQMSGRSFLVENYDPLCALTYWRRGELDFKSWLGSLRSVDEIAWFASDDLRPFGLMCVQMGWRLATRALRRHGDRSRSAKGPHGAAGTTALPRFERVRRHADWTRTPSGRRHSQSEETRV